MSRRRAYLALFLTVVFWGASFIATKVALRELTPPAIVAGRFALGVLVLVVVVRVRGAFRAPTRRDLPGMVLLGFLAVTLHPWLQATGLRTASATVTAWIVASIPVFVAVLGRVFLGERLGVSGAMGIALAAAGVLVVVSGGEIAGLISGRVGTTGDVLIVLSALNWAVFTVLSKRLLRSDAAQPAARMLVVIVSGWALSLPWAAADGGWRAYGSLSFEGWLAIAFLGLACSGLAYVFWYDALDAVEATQAGAFLYLEPLVTALLARPMLGERWTPALLVGGAGILLGVWMVNRRSAGSRR